MAIDSQEIVEDLGKLALLLNVFGVCTDINALYTMQNEMRTIPADLLWCFDTDNCIVFQIPKMSHTRPEDIDDISISLTVKSQGSKDIEESKNHFLHLDMQLVLTAYCLDANCNEKTVKSAWHMDMDTNPDNDFVHPLFHINFGGKELEELADTGEILLLRSPRLMHPPLDIFLAVDFVVQNFFGRKHTIFQEFEYQRIMAKYRELHWKPYILAFASNYYDFSAPPPLSINKTFSQNILGN
jgi:hypothetical protein